MSSMPSIPLHRGWPLLVLARHGSHDALRPLRDALYENHAEIVIEGHEHVYERGSYTDRGSAACHPDLRR